MKKKGKKKTKRPHQIPKHQTIPSDSPTESAMESTRTEAGYYDEVQRIMEAWRIKAQFSREDGRRSLSELLLDKNDTDEEAITALRALELRVFVFMEDLATMTCRYLKFLHYDPKKVRVAAGTFQLMSLAGGYKRSMVTGFFAPLIEKLHELRKEHEESDCKEDAERENRIFAKIFIGFLFLELVVYMPSFLGKTQSEKKNWAEKIGECMERFFKERLKNLESEIKLLKEEDLNCQTDQINADKHKAQDDAVAGLSTISDCAVELKPTAEQSESNSKEVGSAIQKPSVLTPDPKPMTDHSEIHGEELDSGILKPGLLKPDPRTEHSEINSEEVISGIQKAGFSTPDLKKMAEHSEENSNEVGSGIQKLGLLTPDPKPPTEQSEDNSGEVGSGFQKPSLLTPNPQSTTTDNLETYSEAAGSEIQKPGLLAFVPTPMTEESEEVSEEVSSEIQKPGLLASVPKPTTEQSETVSEEVGSGIQKPGLLTPVLKAMTEQSESDSKVVHSGIQESGSLIPDPKPTTKESETNSEELSSAKMSVSGVRFEEVKSFDDFHILVDGTVLDSELSEETRMTYYTLCCTQNAFLHENIINGHNKWLILGAIVETVAIADAVKTSSRTAISRDEFTVWEKSLRAFELLGMTVGFLHARLSRLAGSPLETGVKEIEAKLAELKEACNRFGGAIQSLKSESPC